MKKHAEGYDFHTAGNTVSIDYIKLNYHIPPYPIEVYMWI